MPEINFLGTLLGAVIMMIVGGLWYGPFFGKPWMKLMGMNCDNQKEVPKSAMVKSYGIMFLGSFIMCHIFSMVGIFASNYFHSKGVIFAVQGAFWNWLGFIVPVSLGTVLWEQKSWKLWFINAGYYLVALSIAGAVMGYMMWGVM